MSRLPRQSIESLSIEEHIRGSQQRSTTESLILHIIDTFRRFGAEDVLVFRLRGHENYRVSIKSTAFVTVYGLRVSGAGSHYFSTGTCTIDQPDSMEKIDEIIEKCVNE